eukprot:jgi/Astpho2/7875/e_gw1.00117.159.1_t
MPKRALPHESDLSESDQSEEESVEEVADVDIQFYDPQDRDFHGLAALLQGYLDGDSFSCSSLCFSYSEWLLLQPQVGTVVKSAEDEDPVAVLSVLNLQQHGSLPCLAEIRSFLLAHCQEASVKEKLQQAWAAPGTGLVVSERLINCPPQLSPPLQQALYDEIQWATEDQPTQARLKSYSFKFSHFLVVSRCFHVPAASSSKGRKKMKVSSTGLVYHHPEDEFLRKHSTWAYTFPAVSRTTKAGDPQHLRLVMLLTPPAVAQAR